MLLSRLAENIYWAGRYLERAEDTARLVKVHTELFMDLPTSHATGWGPLLAVTGTSQAYNELGDSAAAPDGRPQELDVVSFLTTSPDNPGSVLMCIDAARTNLRSVRALIPRSGWEQANRLHLWSRDTAAQAAPRRSRVAWADDVIRKCQTINGLLDGQMSRDEAYAFLLLGRHLERADMTTRVLDVQARVLLDGVGDGQQYGDVSWMAVLKSVSAMQMFRRVARAGVSGSRALNFLLCDHRFPRSVTHGLNILAYNLGHLPRHEVATAAVEATRDRVGTADLDADLKAMAPKELHDFMDHLQSDLGQVHESIAATWFDLDAVAEATKTPPTGTATQSQTQS